jgi:putative flippase GtrA
VTILDPQSEPQARAATAAGTATSAAGTATATAPLEPDHHRPGATDRAPHLLSENLVLALVRRLYREAAKFGTVGIVCAVVDLGVFNALSVTGAPLHTHPITARTISVLIATVVSYIGNRWWTWRDRERSSLAREYSLFFAINLVGLALNLGILAFAEYGLGWHSGLERNFANLVGIGVGTIVRFFAYRRWVFMESTAAGDAGGAATTSVAP